LIKLRKKVEEKNNEINKINFIFDKNIQLEISNHLAELFGYDFNIGRVDISQHPFSSGTGNDVRITTRLDEADPFNCFFSTIHETGHAVYEQNIPKEYIFTPNGSGVSMGVHESQSRIFENQFGRSKQFCIYLFKLMRDRFGDFGVKSDEDFYKIVNNVKNSFIRTEADEINYNLHILMRYDLEKELFKDNLQVEDLEDAWNERFKLDFQLDVKELSDGFLQDVHWSAGLFGYFPTYTLGNIYAGCLFEKILNTNNEILNKVQYGEFSDILEWLKKNIYVYGSTEKPEKIISNAIGKSIDEKPLIDYLNKKFNEIYI
jgi:carboxypeptidase Taq